jgi:hypothetical protein
MFGLSWARVWTFVHAPISLWPGRENNCSCRPTPGPQTDRTGLRQAQTLLRKLDARTIEATWRGIGQLLDAFTPQECANYFRNSGYGSA